MPRHGDCNIRKPVQLVNMKERQITKQMAKIERLKEQGCVVGCSVAAWSGTQQTNRECAAHSNVLISSIRHRVQKQGQQWQQQQQR